MRTPLHLQLERCNYGPHMFAILSSSPEGTVGALEREFGPDFWKLMEAAQRSQGANPKASTCPRCFRDRTLPRMREIAKRLKP